jgi:predicted amino acid dehydrogenase
MNALDGKSASVFVLVARKALKDALAESLLETRETLELGCFVVVVSRQRKTSTVFTATIQILRQAAGMTFTIHLLLIWRKQIERSNKASGIRPQKVYVL